MNFKPRINSLENKVINTDEEFRPFNDESETYLEDLMDQESNSVDDEFEKYDDSLPENEDVQLVPETEPKNPDYSKPPKLELSDMLNEEGDIVDFSQAENYHQLIEMITREGSIKNQLGQELPAETVINLIYKLTYQDIGQYQKEDWTNITLRHKLRETVAKLILDYKKSDEFKALAGLDLSGAKTIAEVNELISKKEWLIDAYGNKVYPYMLINHIKEGKLHLLPELIRFKVIEINKKDSEEYMSKLPETKIESKNEKSFMGRLGNAFSRLKFWKK